MEVALPPLPEQCAIAHILGTLDDKIELNRRMNQTLEEMARAIFQDWFVDFGPIRAKLEGREPYLPPELWSLFPDRLADSELGQIPEGWEALALEQFVGLNPSEPMKKGTISPYIDMATLPTSGSSPGDAILREFTSGTRFRNGDTLFARITPCLENGKTAFVQALPKGTVGWGSTEFIVMRASPPVPPEYSYLLARNEAFREHAIQSMTGTSGRQRVQVDALAPYLLPFPPADVWANFSSLVSPVFASIELSRKASRSIAIQRDALLPKLVSGEFRFEKELLHGRQEMTSPLDHCPIWNSDAATATEYKVSGHFDHRTGVIHVAYSARAAGASFFRQWCLIQSFFTCRKNKVSANHLAHRSTNAGRRVSRDFGICDRVCQE